MDQTILSPSEKAELFAKSRRAIGTLEQLIAQEEADRIPTTARQWEWTWAHLPKVKTHLAKHQAPLVLEQCFLTWSIDAMPAQVVVADLGTNASELRRCLHGNALLEAEAINAFPQNLSKAYTNGLDWFFDTDPQTLRRQAGPDADTRPFLLARRLDFLLPGLMACQSLVAGDPVEFLDLRRLP